MSIPHTNVIVLAGPNGAGKSTTAPKLLRDVLGVVEFINADVLALGLAPYSHEAAAFEAADIMLRRLRSLGERRQSFAFETTLASRTYAPWLVELIQSGYHVQIAFLWLSSADLAVHRVAGRVQMGGHHISSETIRRRYAAGIRNFFRLYQPLARTWRFYDNSDAERIRLVAAGHYATASRVANPPLWQAIREEYDRGY
jgi:predicted ABC-type ATPase